MWREWGALQWTWTRGSVYVCRWNKPLDWSDVGDSWVDSGTCCEGYFVTYFHCLLSTLLFILFLKAWSISKVVLMVLNILLHENFLFKYYFLISLRSQDHQYRTTKMTISSGCVLLAGCARVGTIYSSHFLNWPSVYLSSYHVLRPNLQNILR